MSKPYEPFGSYQPEPLPERSTYSDAEMVARSAEFLDLVRGRRTCRYFADTPVPREVIENAILAAGTAPSGANHQPWHFAVIAKGPVRTELRKQAEQEEKDFYAGRGSDEWLKALEPLGTEWEKPFLEVAPWLIVVFAERYGVDAEGNRYNNYYVPESVGMAAGLLVTSLHNAGLATLTHTPSPMGFLREICGRPDSERPIMIVVAGHPAPDATVPKKAGEKKTLDQIASFIEGGE